MKFKVGDKVKYIGKYSSFIACNTIGTITRRDVDDCGWDVLFPCKIEWFCVENNLVKIITKNQQLVFDFYME